MQTNCFIHGANLRPQLCDECARLNAKLPKPVLPQGHVVRKEWVDTLGRRHVDFAVEGGVLVTAGRPKVDAWGDAR